ncbi:unnamed protein product, partial [Meganyctiphanes norvegica]
KAEEKRSLALAQKKNLQEELLNKQSLLEATSKNLAEITKSEEEQKKMLQKLQEDVNRTQLQNTKMEAELQEVRSAKARNRSLLTKQIEGARRNNRQYIQEIEKKKIRLAENHQAFEEAAEQICTLKSNNDLLEAYVDEQEQKIITITEYNNNIEQNLSIKRKELIKVQSRSEEVLVEVKELQDSNDILISTIREWQNTAEKIKESIESVTTEKDVKDHLLEQQKADLKQIEIQ